MIVKIAEPCQESWEGMTREETGEHCAVCSKTVPDFTNKPKEELLAFLLCSTLSPYLRMLSSHQHFTPEEVKTTATRLHHSGIKIPASAMALVMLWSTSSCTTCNHANSTGSSPDTTQSGTISTTDSPVVLPGMLRKLLPPNLSDTSDMGEVKPVSAPPPKVLPGEVVFPEPIPALQTPYPTLGVPYAM